MHRTVADRQVLDPSIRVRRHARRAASGVAARVVAALLLPALAAAPAAGQGRYHQVLVPGLSSFDAENRASPVLVDLDADGDLDALVGNSRGRVLYFENAGSATAPVFVTRTSNPFASLLLDFHEASPELADLDADGDLDLVLGDRNVVGTANILRYFENTGSASAHAFVERTGATNPFDGLDLLDRPRPELSDLDGDGDLDLTVAEESGTVQYFENTGSTAVPEFVERTGGANPFDGVDVGLHSSVSLSDLDGDGDFDAVLGDVNGQFRYYENTGSPLVPAFVQRTGSANPLDGLDVGFESNPELVDLDGDADLDLVAGEALGGLVYVENTGSPLVPAFVERTGAANPFGGYDLGSVADPAVGDLDCDGDLDVVVSQDQGMLHFFENTGTATVPSFVERTGAANPLDGITVDDGRPVLADLDADGDFDAAVGVGNGEVRYFENVGSPTVPSFVERTGAASPFDGIDVGVNADPALADLDGDGDLDALVVRIGQMSTEPRYFENTGTPAAAVFVERTGGANPFDAIESTISHELVDFDRDGDVDLAAGRFDGFSPMGFWLNVGSPASPAFVDANGPGSPFLDLRVGGGGGHLVDLDADGDLDAVLGEGGGKVVVFRSALLFADGFESGDLGGWTELMP